MTSKQIATRAFQYPIGHGTFDGSIEHLSNWISEYAIAFLRWTKEKGYILSANPKNEKWFIDPMDEWVSAEKLLELFENEK